MRKTLATTALTLGLVFASAPGAVADPPHPIPPPPDVPAECQDYSDALDGAWADVNARDEQIVQLYIEQVRLEHKIARREHRINYLQRVRHRQAREIRHLRAQLAANR